MDWSLAAKPYADSAPRFDRDLTAWAELKIFRIYTTVRDLDPCMLSCRERKKRMTGR